jgi:intraflagellar transport protein 81
MHWVLVRYPALTKRAYLAKYLMPSEIPPEVLADEGLLALNQQLKELQEQFKQTHKTLDQLRSSDMRPVIPCMCMYVHCDLPKSLCRMS